MPVLEGSFADNVRQTTEKDISDGDLNCFLSASFSVTPVEHETHAFLILRNKVNNIVRFIAGLSGECQRPGGCYKTGASEEINEIISHRDHNQVGMIVSFGKGFDGVDGWYPKGFHRFENGSAETFFDSIPLLQFHKTISSVIGEMKKCLS